MKVDKYKIRQDFKSEEGETLSVYYTNRGEPYREGIEISFDNDGQYGPSVFLEDDEAKSLRDLLLKRYPLIITQP